MSFFVCYVAFLLALVTVIAVAAAVCYAHHKGLEQGTAWATTKVQQQAVDRGLGHWTIIAAKPVFLWGADAGIPARQYDDDAQANANQPPAAPSREAAGPTGHG